jgi:predicted dehydrogenase
MTELKAAVIGTGRIARQHLQCLAQLPGVRTVAVCDLWQALAEATGERYGAIPAFTDHRRMLEETQPDVVHVTTPPNAHFRLASDALDSGANVIVEKPITPTYDEFLQLASKATTARRMLIEDYNYLFNKSVRRIKSLLDDGQLGEVVHVEVFICLDILGKGSPFADRNAPHPCLKMPGGAIADFLPHLASLAHLFVGAHEKVDTIWSKHRADSPLPSDEFRAQITAKRGTASLGFSANIQPDVFMLRVCGTRLRAEANLFEPRLTVQRTRGGPKPLTPLLNGMSEARDIRRASVGGLWRKLSGGPGAYEGLWELLAQTYASLQTQTEPPLTLDQMAEVNRLVADLTEGSCTEASCP